LGLIEKDLAYLGLKAKEKVKKYIDEYLPAEYEKCLDGLKNIMKDACTESIDSDSDRRERMQALTLVKECYAMKLELISSVTVVDRAIRFVENHRAEGLGNTSQNIEVLIDDTTKLKQTARQVRAAVR
jgi:hypothetical protein